LDISCGTNTDIFAIAAAAMADRRGMFKYPRTAIAQAVLPKFWELKSSIMARAEADIA
jgi:hypothetical protein